MQSACCETQERMSECELQIEELSAKVKRLEVEASSLAARNSLLQRVASLRPNLGADQPTAASQPQPQNGSSVEHTRQQVSPSPLLHYARYVL